MSDWLFDLGNSRFKAAPWHPGGGIGEVLAWPHGADALAAGASHLVVARPIIAAADPAAAAKAILAEMDGKRVSLA